jgi:hypothetical protein
MAGKATSVYVTVHVKGDPFDIVERKQFFNSKTLNVWMKDAISKYPPDQFRITKETY